MIDKEFVQQVLDASPAAVRIVGLDHTIFYSNKKYDALNKTFNENIIGSSCKNYFCAWYCNTDKCAIQTIKNTNKAFHFEHVKKTDNGAFVVYLFDIKPFLNDVGDTIGIIESIIDITDIKKKERELQQNKEELEALIEQRTQEVKLHEERIKINYKVAHEGIWDFNINTNEIYFSPTLYTLLGYEPYAFEQSLKSLIALIHPNDREIAAKAKMDFIHNSLDSQISEFRLKRKKGDYIWVRNYGLALERDKQGKKQRVVGSFTDIDAEKRALLSHMESEAKYRKLVEQISDWIWETDKDHNYSYSSPQVEHILGYKPTEIIEQAPWKFIEPSNYDYAQGAFEKFARNKESFSGLITIHKHKNNSSVFIETSAKPITNEKGELQGYMGVNRDVTQRVKAELEIIEREEQMAEAFNATEDFIIITNLKGAILQINKSVSTFFQKQRIILNQTTIQTLFANEKVDTYIKSFNKDKLSTLELDFVKETKSLVFELSGRAFPIKGKTAILNIVRDITARKDFERRLLQTVIDTEEKERLRFAKDLHDGLGPQLSAIRLYVNSLGMPSYTEAKKKQMINNAKQIIDNAIASTKEIANNLMPSVLQNFGLVKALQLFCNDVTEVHKIKINLNSDALDQVLAHKIEVALYRILSELINNTIKHAAASEITIDIKSLDAKIWVCYSDNGIGMDVDALNAKGNGLENIKSRIHSLNGQVEIATRPQKGFKMELLL